jgi:hypothetical protein
MEYHKSTFTDFSLLVFNKDTLVGLLPANTTDSLVYSHQGLTYGGLLLLPETKLPEAIFIFKTVLQYLQSQKITQLILKPIPNFYTTFPSQEIDYILFLTQAKNIQTNTTSVIQLQNKIPFNSLRKRGVKKGEKNNLLIKEESLFEAFWEQILIPNLQQQHQVKPVHSLEEITKLAAKFPNNIRQFNVYYNTKIVGGTTIFETKNTAHAQYISAGTNKQELGTLDFLFNFLIKERFKDKQFFDFGISNEDQGKKINNGLLQWKEGFGARTNVHQIFAIDPKNHYLLDTIFI